VAGLIEDSGAYDRYLFRPRRYEYTMTFEYPPSLRIVPGGVEPMTEWETDAGPVTVKS